MEITSPVWSLRVPRCPDDKQGALCFSSCPGCGEILLICDEVGHAFQNLRDLGGDSFGTIDDPLTLCPRCGEVPLSGFRNSASEEIQGLGFAVDEYE
jgi:hypothetical protein